MKRINVQNYKKYREGFPADTLARVAHVDRVIDDKEDATILDTPMFQFGPLAPGQPVYTAVPKMIHTHTRIKGKTSFGNTLKVKGYKISGKIAIDTGFFGSYYYIGTLSSNVNLTGTYPWKVTGQVEAFDDSLLVWHQSGLASGAFMSDSLNGGIAATKTITIIEDYNTAITPGTIDLYLYVADGSGDGRFGNISFEYDLLYSDNINLKFENIFYP